MNTSGHRQPEYYQSSVETIDCILALGPQDAIGFCRGNILKYTMRYRGKGGLEDLKKASWYMDLLWAIESHLASGKPWKLIGSSRELMEQYGRP